MNDVQSFEGTIGMAVEHDWPLVPPRKPIEAWIELGQGNCWRRVGKLLFGEDGRKRDFELDPELVEAVRRSAIREQEWLRKEEPLRRQSPEVSLAWTVSRLAAQVRDIRDLEWYRDNPVHLPHTGQAFLRTSTDEPLSIDLWEFLVFQSF